ncbi:hypothetical protein O181_128850 [Austropuccinia psidii MF-1]|uniref:Uncharacterized protein n=1 Tax=Austropuccinia psidii MF-1 TaxID=1389203 RepID=A0A9Q3L103_9BASI|nr:hypothetical protein [Austropuccinia psidii MF-1]
MPVQASNNSHPNPDAFAGLQQFKEILTPGQDSNNSYANPYACAGSDNAQKSLCLWRLATVHTPILTLVKVPNNAGNFLCLCRLPPILTLVKVPNNLNNSIHD